VGEWFGQAVHAEIVEIEDASYFDIFSETAVGKVVEGEDIWPSESFRQVFRTKVLTTPLPTYLWLFLLSPLMYWH
jgi:hypothetical protein